MGFDNKHPYCRRKTACFVLLLCVDISCGISWAKSATGRAYDIILTFLSLSVMEEKRLSMLLDYKLS